jgi:hypothetical protein
MGGRRLDSGEACGGRLGARTDRGRCLRLHAELELFVAWDRFRHLPPLTADIGTPSDVGASS